MSEMQFILINVGNSRISFAQFQHGQVTDVTRVSTDDIAAVVDAASRWWSEMSDSAQRAVVLGSVNQSVSDRLISMLEDQLSTDVYEVEKDMPVAIGRQLDPETITGVDRLLNAAAAYDRVKQACVVVDAGTAVTVDFVDGEGTFHGGAIAPGAQMQLRAMHQHTDALPEMTFQPPMKGEAIGRSTGQAMLQGVYYGIRGMVSKLVEQYATYYGAYPMVIATGGDAATIFSDDEFIDHVVPELTLIGLATTATYAIAADTSD